MNLLQRMEWRDGGGSQWESRRVEGLSMERWFGEGGFKKLAGGLGATIAQDVD